MNDAFGEAYKCPGGPKSFEAESAALEFNIDGSCGANISSLKPLSPWFTAEVPSLERLQKRRLASQKSPVAPDTARVFANAHGRTVVEVSAPVLADAESPVPLHVDIVEELSRIIGDHGLNCAEILQEPTHAAEGEAGEDPNLTPSARTLSSLARPSVRSMND